MQNFSLKMFWNFKFRQISSPRSELFEMCSKLRNKLEVTIARVLPHSQGIKGSMCMQFAE